MNNCFAVNERITHMSCSLTRVTLATNMCRVATLCDTQMGTYVASELTSAYWTSLPPVDTVDGLCIFFNFKCLLFVFLAFISHVLSSNLYSVVKLQNSNVSATNNVAMSFYWW
jgi:hypothetical protein